MSPQPYGLRFYQVLLCCSLLLSFISPVEAHESNTENPKQLLTKHRARILQISSDTEALSFQQNIQQLKRQQTNPSLSRKHPNNRKNIELIPQEVKDTITTFWAAMSTIAYAQTFHATVASEAEDLAIPPTLPSESQQNWLLSKSALTTLQSTLALHKKLLNQPTISSGHSHVDDEYVQFLVYREKQYHSTHNQYWTQLLLEQGYQGIYDMLDDYWQQDNSQKTNVSISTSQQQTYMQHYVASYLLPKFYTQLFRQVAAVEAQAYRTAWETWMQIQEWQAHIHTDRALERLCGKWKWIIHNHLNHGDHKTILTFGSQKTSPGQPAVIRLNGDTVYLQWIFPQGTQEDSLLLSNRDTRLEGTFANSMGPHGTISGQRLSSCQD